MLVVYAFELNITKNKKNDNKAYLKPKFSFINKYIVKNSFSLPFRYLL